MATTVTYRVGTQDGLGRYPLQRITHEVEAGLIQVTEQVTIGHTRTEELAYRTARVLNRSLEFHLLMDGAFESFRVIEVSICAAEWNTTPAVAA